MPSNEPSEISPLLPKPVQAVETGDTPAGPHPSGSEIVRHINDIAKSNDVEGQDGTENGKVATQYQGMPDVKKRLKYIVPAVAIGIFMSAGDQTIIISSYGRIGSELKALNNTSWIATAYFLTLTSFQPLYGKLSDIFGRKPALLFAYVIFAVGCLFCGLARNMNELIAARAFAGIGGGGMTTVVSVIMSDIVPLRERGTWQGIINIIYATGAGTGAPLGGILADKFGWRWAFLGQVPLCALAILLVGVALQLPKVESSSWKAKLRRIDFLGAFALVCAIFTLLLGLDRGSNVSWSTAICLVPLCLSLPLFAVFILVEQKYATEPFAPKRIWLSRSLFACYLCNFFSFASWLSLLYFLSLFWQAVNGFTSTHTGLLFLPSIVAGTLGSLFGGIVMQKTGRYYWMTVCAYTMLTLGMIPILLFSDLVANSTYGVLFGLVICSFSTGVGVTTTLIGLIANASREDQAIATACSYLFRSLGSVVGLSLSATVVQQTLRNQLRDRLGSGKEADNIIQKVRQSLDYIRALDPDTQEIVKKCYSNSTRAGFSFLIGVAAFAAISSWFVREKKLMR
ncbi:hypothetical protein MMC14_008294 [Varicellaria rhodocarpa]|nr:hypothetical protein [Varicellaria rhodocarpa]